MKEKYKVKKVKYVSTKIYNQKSSLYYVWYFRSFKSSFQFFLWSKVMCRLEMRSYFIPYLLPLLIHNARKNNNNAKVGGSYFFSVYDSCLVICQKKKRKKVDLIKMLVAIICTFSSRIYLIWCVFVCESELKHDPRACKCVCVFIRLIIIYRIQGFDPGKIRRNKSHTQTPCSI